MPRRFAANLVNLNPKPRETFCQLHSSGRWAFACLEVCSWHALPKNKEFWLVFLAGPRKAWRAIFLCFQRVNCRAPSSGMCGQGSRTKKYGCQQRQACLHTGSWSVSTFCLYVHNYQESKGTLLKLKDKGSCTGLAWQHSLLRLTPFSPASTHNSTKMHSCKWQQSGCRRSQWLGFDFSITIARCFFSLTGEGAAALTTLTAAWGAVAVIFIMTDRGRLYISPRIESSSTHSIKTDCLQLQTSLFRLGGQNCHQSSHSSSGLSNSMQLWSDDVARHLLLLVAQLEW